MTLLYRYVSPLASEALPQLSPPPGLKDRIMDVVEREAALLSSARRAAGVADPG